MAITYRTVPQYGYVDRFIKEKREGFGWNDLGPRDIKFVTLHRMVGTLTGTDGYFRKPSISSYTDFGLSTALSDPHLTPGTIYLWNHPDGRRAPWASGPVSAPYGDGKAIVDKYGIDAVNRDGISLEIGGYNEPIDEASWKEIVHFIAYWADQCKVPYTSFPINPHTGISFVIWHNEFTAGTGKQCPFMWLRDNTPRLITDVKEMLQRYQEQAPKPAPEPAVRTVNFLVPMMVRNSPGFWNREKDEPNVVATLPAGTKGTVISGPVMADGMEWYDVRIPGFGTGFVAKAIINAIQVK